MTEIIESYTETRTTNSSIYDDRRTGQSFTIGNTGSNILYRLDSVDFYGYDYSDNGGYTIAFLKAADGVGKPTGAVLSTGSIATDSLSETYDYNNISMSSYMLQPSTKYVIYFQSTIGTILMGIDDETVSYTGGNTIFSDDAGLSWSNIAWDCLFKVYGTPIQGKINIGDDWKTIDAYKINISDSWKPINSIKINIGNDWKTVF